MTKRTGRRPGSPETRDEIIASARRLFADAGFTHTSVRAIAQDAGVDPSLIHHYFGTKEGLFQACLELPIRPDDIVHRVLTGPLDELPRRIVTTFLSVWEDEQTGPAMQTLLRRALSDPTQVDLMREFMFTRLLHTPVGDAIAPERAERELRLGLVVTHLMGAVIARQLLHFDPLASLTQEQAADLLEPPVRHALFGDLPRTQTPGAQP